jgi:hypothetical protein
MNRIEALALAIAKQNDVLEPGSEAFMTLNPGLLRSYGPERTDVVNEDGVRIFDTLQGGLRALLANLEAKCQGRTKANGDNGKLCPQSTLMELCKTFRYLQPRKVAEFLQDALNDAAVNERTPLQYFLEN